jgi:hypothetical protein
MAGIPRSLAERGFLLAALSSSDLGGARTVRRGVLLRGAISTVMPLAVLALLFVLLPLGTTPMEGAALIAAGAALLGRQRREQPLLAPALVLLFALGMASGGRGGAGLWAAALGAWAWVLVVALPPLTGQLSAVALRRVETAGLWAAALAGGWALVEVGMSGAPPWERPVDGPFSHHLTLGYALLPPLARALHTRRWGFGVLIGLGVLSAGASGPLLAGVVLGVALWAPPIGALAGGVAVTLVTIVVLAGDPELYQRVVLWTSGGVAAVQQPLGVGGLGARGALSLAQFQLLPGFHFPLHAHDSALQLSVVGGFGAWIAVAWLLVALWRRSHRAGRAAIAAVVVGGLTQDTVGDLEVLRSLCAWALLPVFGEPGDAAGVESSDRPGDDDS